MFRANTTSHAGLSSQEQYLVERILLFIHGWVEEAPSQTSIAPLASGAGRGRGTYPYARQRDNLGPRNVIIEPIPQGNFKNFSILVAITYPSC